MQSRTKEEGEKKEVSELFGRHKRLTLSGGEDSRQHIGSAQLQRCSPIFPQKIKET